MNIEEFKASDMLLDLGVSVPLRPLGFLSRRFWRVTIRRPYLGTLIRICKVYASIGVNYNEIKEYDLDQSLAFYAKHGKAISEIVAYAICRGYVSGMLFHPVVAAVLRWRAHPLVLTELYVKLAEFMNTKSFLNIISLTDRLNVLRPRLSQEEENGS